MEGWDLTSLLLLECGETPLWVVVLVVLVESVVWYGGIAWMGYMVGERGIRWEWLLAWGVTVGVYLLCMLSLSGRLP